MQPHRREQDCSCDTTENHRQETPFRARHGEVEYRNGPDGQERENSVARGPGREIEEINMSLASSIPTQVVAGCALERPLVVLLHRGTQSSTAIDDIWVFVSLVDAGSNTQSGESDDVLKGQRADNAHPVLGYCSMSEGAFAYASFSNLTISRAGKYRLCVTAIDMR